MGELAAGQFAEVLLGLGQKSESLLVKAGFKQQHPIAILRLAYHTAAPLVHRKGPACHLKQALVVGKQGPRFSAVEISTGSEETAQQDGGDIAAEISRQSQDPPLFWIRIHGWQLPEHVIKLSRAAYLGGDTQATGAAPMAAGPPRSPSPASA